MTNAKFKNVSEEDQKFLDAQELLGLVLKSLPAEDVLKNRVFVAGGAVRDEVMGKVPKDIDITVEAEEGGIIFAKFLTNLLDLRSPVIFPTYGTAQIVLKDCEFAGKEFNVEGVEVEMVATRKEQYHDPESRNPEVSFGTLAEDVERRDFTVNSLLKNLETGEIVDLTGKGLEDIANGVIRTPLNPDIIFGEDGLRIMRAVRFAVKYGWTLAPEVVSGIKKNIDRLGNSSNERIRDEFDKIIKVNKAHVAIPLMDELGILEKVLPEMHALKGVEQDTVHHSEGDAYVHSLGVVKNLETLFPESDIATVLAAIGHDWGKAHTQTFDGDRIHFYKHDDVSAKLVDARLRELKYPLDIVAKAKFLAENHMRGHSAKEWGPKAFRKFREDMKKYKQVGSETVVEHDHYESILALLESDQRASIAGDGVPKNTFEFIREKMPEVTKIKVPEKPILGGKDIMDAFFIGPGPRIGEIQKFVKDLVLESPELIVEGDEEQTKANIINEVKKEELLIILNK
jgi:poly(A) polymerase